MQILQRGKLLDLLRTEILRVMSVFTIIEGECFRIDEGVAGDPGWSWRVVTAERL
jgi:hypothetical protein